MEKLSIPGSEGSQELIITATEGSHFDKPSVFSEIVQDDTTPSGITKVRLGSNDPGVNVGQECGECLLCGILLSTSERQNRIGLVGMICYPVRSSNEVIVLTDTTISPAQSGVVNAKAKCGLHIEHHGTLSHDDLSYLRRIPSSSD